MLPLPILALIGGGAAGGGGCPETAPATPSYFLGTPGDTTVWLDWPDVDCTEEYDIFWDNARGDGNADTFLVTVFAPQNFYNHTGLTNGIEYHYKIRSANAYGDSAFTVTAGPFEPSAAPGAPTAPSSPTSAMQVVNTTIQVGWNDNSGDETHFNIYRSVNGGAFSLLNTAAANATTYDDTGLTLGNDYSYQISAENATAESAKTSSTTVTNLGATAVPTGVGTSGATFSSLLVSWTSDQTPPWGVADNHKIYRDSVHIATVAGATFSYSDTGLADGTVYSYTVTTINAAGESAQSSPGAGATLLLAPTGLGWEGIGEEEPWDFARFTWTDTSSNEVSFKLYRDAVFYTSVGAGVTQADVVWADATGFTWTVKAGGGAGVADSAASNGVAV